MLRTRPLPLEAQDNEELVHLQVNADTGNLRSLDMLLNPELFLCFAVDRRTACVTHWLYAFGSGMVSPLFVVSRNVLMCVGHLIRTDRDAGSFSWIAIDYYTDWDWIAIDYYTDWDSSTEELHSLGRLHLTWSATD